METRERPDRMPGTKTAFDSDAPQTLIDFMSGGWLDQPAQASAHPQVTRLHARRKELGEAFAGTYLIVPAGAESVRANDTFYRFRPSSDFAYLMGDGEPDALLVFEPVGKGHETLLFVRDKNRGKAEFLTDRLHGELWLGRRRGVDASKTYYGVDRCRPLGEASEYLESLRTAGHRTLALPGDAELAVHLSEARLIKDEYEIDELRKAVAITKRGFEDVIRTMRHARSEREIEAAFWSRARIEANDVGYLTIAASGEHACTLHWTHNNGAIDRSSLLLLDAGVECDSLYTADVTRTLPIGGKFSGEQRAIYDLVWEAQREAFDAVKPGNDFLEPNRRAMRVLAQGLIDLDILKTSLDEALDPANQFYRRYTLHNVSHMLGIDVHDCAKARSEHYRNGALRKGIVLTVEPGLYLQPDDATVPERFRGIGVRIEDDAVVTAEGYENLSAALPSRATDVERWVEELWR